MTFPIKLISFFVVLIVLVLYSAAAAAQPVPVGTKIIRPSGESTTIKETMFLITRPQLDEINVTFSDRDRLEKSLKDCVNEKKEKVSPGFGWKTLAVSMILTASVTYAATR